MVGFGSGFGCGCCGCSTGYENGLYQDAFAFQNANWEPLGNSDGYWPTEWLWNGSTLNREQTSERVWNSNRNVFCGRKSASARTTSAQAGDTLVDVSVDVTLHKPPGNISPPIVFTKQYSIIGGIQFEIGDYVPAWLTTPTILIRASWTRGINFSGQFTRIDVNATGSNGIGGRVALGNVTLLDIASDYAGSSYFCGNLRYVLKSRSFPAFLESFDVVTYLNGSQIGSARIFPDRGIPTREPLCNLSNMLRATGGKFGQSPQPSGLYKVEFDNYSQYVIPS